MNIIVTNNTIEYSGFMKVKTLKEAISITGNIDFLVYHKSNETREGKVECLTKLKKRVSTFVYIRDKQSVEQAVQMIIVGSGGKYFDDEFFLENSAELTRLIRGLNEVTALAELGGVNVVSDFFNKYLKNGSTGFNSAYLSIVKDAVSNMVTEYRQKDLELVQLSETATDLFANSLDLVSKVDSERENLKGIVKTLEKARSQGKFEAVSQPTFSSNILFFPQVSYIKEKNIIRIKEIGNFSFLVSFMLGFRLYLETIKYVRPKLIIIFPIGEQFERQYQDYKWITQQNAKTMGNYYDKVVFTNFPNRDVISRLLDDTEFDTFIVVDRTKGSHKHILNSKGGSVRYAVSGESSMNSFSLKPISCFSNTRIKNSLFTLGYFDKYPEEKEQRERLYLKICNQYFESLYNIRR